ncbi:hypothetical protein ACPYPE_23885 [Streptomyces griseus]|uniref:hypothetical protein n=1 Tax=Streptomyces griseus TaxID=1911 RepID=UPI003CF26243
MKSHNQARANEARQRQSQTGESYAAALQAIRLERLSRLGDISEADGAGGHDPVDLHERAVPEELTELVRYHSHRIAKYLYFAVDEGRYREDLAEWQRNTLYKLTDGLEHLHLLIGTIAAYLRETGVTDDFLRRYLQVRNDRQVEAYFTPSVQEHLAGLTGRQAPQNSVVWHDVGRHIANHSGWSSPERHDELEVALHALYANYPDDSRAFDHLPPDMQMRILAVLNCLRT